MSCSAWPRIPDGFGKRLAVGDRALDRRSWCEYFTERGKVQRKGEGISHELLHVRRLDEGREEAILLILEVEADWLRRLLGVWLKLCHDRCMGGLACGFDLDYQTRQQVGMCAQFLPEALRLSSATANRTAAGDQFFRSDLFVEGVGLTIRQGAQARRLATAASITASDMDSFLSAGSNRDAEKVSGPDDRA